MWKRVKAITKAWGDYECASLAAGVAYYGALSLFPLMLILLSGVGYFFRFMSRGPDAREEILTFISLQISPEVSESLGKILTDVQGQSLANGPLAAVIFIFTASLVFAQIDRGFYRIWDQHTRPKNRGFWAKVKRVLSHRLRSVLMILAIGLLIIVMFIGGLIFRTLSEIGTSRFPALELDFQNMPLLVATIVNVMILTLLYRFLSKEPVTWKLCGISSLITAGFWELGSRLLTVLSFGSNFSVYGIIGSFLVVMLWIYYNVMVLFLGALIVRVEAKKPGKR